MTNKSHAMHRSTHWLLSYKIFYSLGKSDTFADLTGVELELEDNICQGQCSNNNGIVDRHRFVTANRSGLPIDFKTGKSLKSGRVA